MSLEITLKQQICALRRAVLTMREALEFYAKEDATSVEDGILESVYDRPATKALEGE